MPHLNQSEVYVCAPTDFIHSTQEILIQAGLSEYAFHMEKFSAENQTFISDGKIHTIHFVKSNLSIDVEGDITLLEAAEKVGIRLPNGCRQGLCKACSCPKIQGLTQLDEHKAQPDRRITLCNSVARSEQVILEI